MSTFEIHKALNLIFETISESNKHVQTLSPWSLNSNSKIVHRALSYARETLRICSILLQPFMPNKSNELLNRLGINQQDRNWNKVQFGQGSSMVSQEVGQKKQEVLFPPIKLPVTTQ
ncbi:methionyl-tRNA synthetase [Microbotryomycetes sp. JL221]|nr:methionyl-tRNA synthetase [Microbotryomycetes sp. JL221]